MRNSPQFTENVQHLTPNTEMREPHVAFDFPGIEVGIASYDEGPTGCTVVYSPNRMKVAYDIRGGGALAVGFLQDELNAICIAGGSTYGLEAIAGMNCELLSENGNRLDLGKIPYFFGALFNDFTPRTNAIYPDRELGRAATRSRKPGLVPTGRQGAGIAATAGTAWRFPAKWVFTGQGAAFRKIGDLRILVITVVNPIGNLRDEDGNFSIGGYVYANDALEEADGDLSRLPWFEGIPDRTSENSSITIVITNAKLDNNQLKFIGRQVHSAMGTMIRPFHTLVEGDSFVCATTNEAEIPGLDTLALGDIISPLVIEAVKNCFDKQE